MARVRVRTASCGLAALIWLLTRVASRRQRVRWELDETSRWSTLSSRRHVLVEARKLAHRP